METNLAQRIARDPNYQKLRSRRNRLGWTLTLLMMIVYYGFILLIAFDKAALAQKVGQATTLAIPLGVGVIVLAWVLTALYVVWANGSHDAQVKKLRDEVKS